MEKSVETKWLFVLDRNTWYHTTSWFGFFNPGNYKWWRNPSLSHLLLHISIPIQMVTRASYVISYENCKQVIHNRIVDLKL